MIETMRDIALLELNRRLSTRGATLTQLRRTHGPQLAPLLVEASEKVPRVYLLQAVQDEPGVVRMWVEELDDAKRRRLPFNRPSGSRSAPIGPVIKRTAKPRERPPYGPSPKIQDTARVAFARLTQGATPWAAYFREICEVLFHSRVLRMGDRDHPVGEGHEDPHVLAAAVRLADEKKDTVFLAVADAAGRWPGDRPEYHAYLAEALAGIKYVTGEAPVREGADCPLCGARGVRIFPNALKGAGINFANMDRAGAFPGLDIATAWKGYGLCLDCADALYIFKNHCLGAFLGRIAGEKALVLPALLGEPDDRQRFVRDWQSYVANLEGNKLRAREAELLEFFLGQDDAYVVIHILWATFGQVIDEVEGVVSDVLPSRLRDLSTFNQKANAWGHALAPREVIDDARFDLSLALLHPLLRRPGVKHRKANSSPRLFAVKRQIAEALYHGRPLGGAAATLWQECMDTARAYLDEAVATGNAYGLLHEGVSRKANRVTRYWTLAGWVRHLARLLYFLDITGALPMEKQQSALVLEMEALKPYFAPGSGIDSHEKAFAFLLGILYGKVLEVQGAKGLNVSANALSWLRRLNLAGRDLPALYNRVREKLLTYGTEGSPEVRALIREIGRVGAQLGDRVALDTTPTCYFLLLGQSVTTQVLPSRQHDDGGEAKP